MSVTVDATEEIRGVSDLGVGSGIVNLRSADRRVANICLPEAMKKIAALPMPSGRAGSGIIARDTAQEAINALLWDRLPTANKTFPLIIAY